MGTTASSTSKISQKNETTIVNRSDIEIINENISENITNTVTNASKQCSAHTLGDQRIEIENIEAEGDINITDINQEQDAALDFSCFQSSTVRNEAATNMVDTVMNALQNNFTAEILDQMDAKASATAKSEALSQPASANSEVEQVNVYTQVNENRKSIQNRIKKSVENNFKTEDLQKCVASVQNNQNVTIKDLKSRSGNVNIRAVSQKQATKAIASCIQKSDLGNKIATDLKNDIGLEVDESNSVKKTFTATATAESTAESTGLATVFDSIGGMIGNILAGLGLAMLAPLAIPISIACCVCCCIIIIAIVFMSMGGGGGEGESTQLGGVFLKHASYLNPFPINSTGLNLCYI